MARLLDEMAAEIGMYIASRLSSSEEPRVDPGLIAALLPEGYEVSIEEVEEGLYQVTISRAGKDVVIIILTYNPHWVSKVTYMGHSVRDIEGLHSLYSALLAGKE